MKIHRPSMSLQIAFWGLQEIESRRVSRYPYARNRVGFVGDLLVVL